MQVTSLDEKYRVELIDTLWNVNDNQQLLALLLRCFELIDTLWNVNFPVNASVLEVTKN